MRGRWALRACALVVLAGCSSTGQPPLPDGATDVGGDADAGACSALCRLVRVAGEPSGGFADGEASAARFGAPVALAGDGTWVYLADRANALIRRVRRADGRVETIAGALRQRGGDGAPPDVPAKDARFAELSALALVGQALYVADGVYLRVVDLAAADRPVRVVRDGGPFNTAWGNAPLRGLSAAAGTVYVAATREIFSYAAGGATLPQHLVGDATARAAARDGDFAAARFADIRGIALSSDAKTLLVIEACAVRAIDLAAHSVSTIAGELASCSAERRDGSGDAARFFDLRAVAVGPDDAIYVADVTAVDRARTAHEQAELGVIRRVVDAAGAITVSTVAGSIAPDSSLAGDANGAAAGSRLVKPEALWFDAAASGGALWIGTPSALRRFLPGRDEVDTIAGRLDEDGILQPGPVLGGSASEGTFVVLRGRGELGRIDAQMRYAPLAVYDIQRFDLLDASGIARVGDDVFVAGSRGVMRRSLADKSSAPLLGAVVLASGGLVEAGGALHWLARDLLPPLSAPTPIIAVIDPSGAASVDKREALGLERIYGLAVVGDDHYAADGTVVARLRSGQRIVDEIAGKRDEGGCDDGPLADARFGSARGLASDGKSRLFVGDVGCNAVRVLDLDRREVRTLVGKPGDGALVTGALDSARLDAPSYLWWDDARAALLVGDPIAGVVLEVTR